MAKQNYSLDFFLRFSHFYKTLFGKRKFRSSPNFDYNTNSNENISIINNGVITNVLFNLPNCVYCKVRPLFKLTTCAKFNRRLVNNWPAQLLYSQYSSNGFELTLKTKNKSAVDGLDSQGMNHCNGRLGRFYNYLSETTYSHILSQS